MNQYDLQRKQLERRQQIADALRASGNEALPASLQTGGRFDAPVSGWQHANKVLEKFLSAYEDRRITKAEKKLTEEQAKAQADWMRGLTEAQASSELQPVAPTGELMPTDNAPLASRAELDPLTPVGGRAPVSLQEQMANRLRGANTYDAAKQAVDAGDQQKLLAHYMRGGDVGGIPAALGAAGIERELLPPVSEPFSLGEGDTRFSGAGSVIAKGAPKTFAPEKPVTTDDITEYSMAVKAGYKGSLQDWILAQKRASASSQVVHLPPQEHAEAAAVGKGYGDTYTNLQQAGRDSNSKITKYNRMNQLLEGVNTGKLTPTMTQISAVGESLGISVDKNLGEKQALEALSSEVALTLRNPSGGAGMPGALSDKDREFLLSMTPGLGKTPEGNRLIIETAKALAQRDQDVAKIARDYRKTRGQLDEGFDDALAEFSAEHQLFGKYTGAATAIADYSDPAEEAAYQEYKKSQQK